MSFSVPDDLPAPPSLQNILKELEDDIGHRAHHDLTAWAEQGVLLLNACLTVPAGNANGHAGLIWEPFTDAMRDELCTRLIARIQELSATHPRLVVTQALYKEQHRQRVQQAFPAMKFLWVRASDDTIRERLVSRGDAVTPDYAAKMRRNFEVPSGSIELLNEGSETEIWERLRGIIFPQ